MKLQIILPLLRSRNCTPKSTAPNKGMPLTPLLSSHRFPPNQNFIGVYLMGETKSLVKEAGKRRVKLSTGKVEFSIEKYKVERVSQRSWQPQ